MNLKGVFMKQIVALVSSVVMCCVLLPASGYAQTVKIEFPGKTIKIIVPYVPGGSTDLLARTLGNAVSEKLKQPVIVENVPGASGNIAVSQLLKQPADGYTIFLGTSAALAVNPHLYKANSPYDPLKDLAPIILATKQASQVLVHPSVPVKTMQELTAYLKSRPNQDNYATAGNGTPGHLGNEMYKLMTGIEMAHIPYKGGAPALAGLAGGQTTMSIAILPESMALVNAGMLRALAITTLERSPQFPNLPTVSESVPGFELISWYGFVVKEGTPKEIVSILNSAFDAALQDASLNKRLSEMGFSVVGGKPEALRDLMVSESDKWGRIVVEAKITLN
jgi:tripartite-type tricarboxylate transporter receptor subunit TctC